MRTPILLKPVAKNYLWGGNRLRDDFKLDVEGSPLAEAWVCSTHSDGVSFVPEFNCTLDELLKKHPEWLGTHPLKLMQGNPVLPVMIKLIDAKKDLSVQVHPDDDYAREHENSLGKTEMWYVLDAKKDSELIYGFNQDVNHEIVKKALNNGTINNLLNHVPIHKNDVFYIEAGTVHAIGAGALVAEIQESSNVTYRIFDYNRVDSNGNKRPLHIEKALEVAKLSANDNPRQPMRVLKYRNGCACEIIARYKYFQVERMLLNTEQNRGLVNYRTEINSFHVLFCVDGCGSMSGDNFKIDFTKGDCVFVPAESVQMEFKGQTQLLDVSC